MNLSKTGEAKDAKAGALYLVKWAIEYASSTGDSWSFEQVVRREIMDMLTEKGIPHCVVDACRFGVGQQRRRLIAGSEDFVRGVAARMAMDPPAITTVQDVLPPRGTHMRNRVYTTSELVAPGTRTLVPATVESQLRTLDKPSWTVTGNSPPRWYDCHTGTTRYLTIREMATLQGFPPSYRFDVPTTVRKRSVMVGNAVPPPVIYAGLCGVRGKTPALLPRSSSGDGRGGQTRR